MDASIVLPVRYDQVGPADPKRPRGGMFAVGRLRRGVSLEAARAELMALWPGVRDATMPPGVTTAQQHDARALHVDVQSFAAGSSNLRERYAEPLKVLMAISAVLLLVACATLSGLLLSQTMSRQQEFATRAALGAGRTHLATQVLLEGIIPTIVGATLAVPLSWWLRHAITATIWTGLSPVTLNVAPDWRTVAVTVMAPVVAGVALGLAPAITVALPPPQMSASARGTTRSTRRLGGTIFVAQVAASAPLVFCAGLLALSAWRLTHVDLGFRGDDVLAARLLPRDNGYAGIDGARTHQDLAADLATLPDVRSVAYSHTFPSALINPETVAASASAPNSSDEPVALEVVSPKFFDTARISLHEDDFTSADAVGATPVAIITHRRRRGCFPTAHSGSASGSVSTLPGRMPWSSASAGTSG